MSNIVFMQCDGTNYRKGRTGVIEYIVIHYTANNGDTAANNGSYFANTKNISASAHYFVDEGNTVVQSVKDSDTAWHCGATSYKHPKCRNGNSIGIELCSRKDSAGRYYFKDAVVANAIILTKELMQKYGIDADHVIRHYDVTGKICPAPFVNDETAWQDFKKKLEREDLTMSQYEELKKRIDDGFSNVTKIINEMSADIEGVKNPMIYNYIDKNMPEWARPTIQKLMDKGYLKGNEEGSLNLKYDTLRILVILDRAGAFN